MELDLEQDRMLPPTVVLLTRPPLEDLQTLGREAILSKYWRLLFHAHIHLALAEKLQAGTLSLADIPAATSLYRYYGLEIERPSLPNVERWYRNLQERTPYRAHVMLPFDELFGRQID